MCNENEKMLVELLVHKDDAAIKLQDALARPLTMFAEECNGLDSYQNLMKLMDVYINSLGSRVFSQYRAYPSENLVQGVRKVLSILPIGDSELHFLADFMDNLSFLMSLLVGLEASKEVLDKLNEAICKTLKKDIFPFLYETATDLKEKRQYIASLLDLISTMSKHSSFIEHFADAAFFDYLSNLDVCLADDLAMRRRVSCIVLGIAGSRSCAAKLNAQPVVKNVVCALNAAEIGSSFSGTQVVHANLAILQQLLKASKDKMELVESKEQLNAEISILAEYKSFGWLSRFLTHRHSKIKIKCWQLLCELVGTDLLLSQGTLLQDAAAAILRQSELYGIKIKAMNFLSCCLDYLMAQEEVGNAQAISLESVVDVIRKSGLISRCKGFFAAKDVPLLFVAVLLNLLKKVIIADYKNVLGVLTQIDFWTLLGDYLRAEEINKCNENNGRRTKFGLSRKLSSKNDVTTFHICVTSIIEFVIECIFRQTQLASHLLKSTKILQNTFSLFTYSTTLHTAANRKALQPILDTYTNRTFTLWTLLAEYEASAAKNIFHDLLSNSKAITVAFEMSYTIDSYAAISRFAAKLAEILEDSQTPAIECNGTSQSIMTRMLEGYELTKSEEENNKENATYNQQKYDMVKSMAVFAHRSSGAKSVVCSEMNMKAVAKDLTHLASVLYCALLEARPEATVKGKNDLIKTKKSVMLNKAIVQRRELLNVGCAHEMLTLLLQFLKSLFSNSGEVVSRSKSSLCANRVEGVGHVMSALMTVYEQTAIMDKELLVSLLEVLCTLASQGQPAKELFLQKSGRRCFMELLIEMGQGFGVGAEPEKTRKVFAILRSLSLSKENVNYIWKSKFIDAVLKKISPLLKATRSEFAEGSSLILSFTKFLSAYAYHEDGRKFLQVLFYPTL